MIRLPRTLAITTALVVATLGLTGAAAHGSGGGHSPTDRFGYTTVRDGVPHGVSRFLLTSPDVRPDGSFRPSAWANAFGCASSGTTPAAITSFTLGGHIISYARITATARR